MYSRLHIRLFVLLFSFAAFAVSAQEPVVRSTKPARPVFSSFSFTAGGARLYDDYLSVSDYLGGEFGFLYEQMRALSAPSGRWVMRHRLDLSAACTRNFKMLSAMVSYSYGLLYGWEFPCGIKLRSGGELALSGGALYCQGNSNNPANAKAVLSLGFSEMLSYTWRLARCPLTFRYHLTLPVAGVFFSPAFGESYYEMFYLGNHAGLAHFGSWHNRFDMGNLLTVEIPLGRHALRLGYTNTIRYSHAEHLRYFHCSHALLAGFSTPLGRKASEARAVWQPFY